MLQKSKIKALATLLALLAFIGSTVPGFAAITADPETILTGAEAAFDTAALLGLSILGVCCVLGAVMIGWRMKSGRGK